MINVKEVFKMTVMYTKVEVETRLKYHEEKWMDLKLNSGSKEQLEIHEKQRQRFEKLLTESLYGDVDITTITK